MKTKEFFIEKEVQYILFVLLLFFWLYVTGDRAVGAIILQLF